MYPPADLQKEEPLYWSTGRGTDVWSLFCACVAGDLEKVRQLFDRDPSLARCQYNYRKPIYFAVRENQLAVAEFLLERDPNPIGLAVNDSLLDIARDRGYGQMQELLERIYAERFGASADGEALATAIRRYDPAAVYALLDEAPQRLHSGDLRGNQPIHWAVMTRQIDLIDQLLDRGADIDARRIDGASPIQLCNGDYHFRGWRDVPKAHATSPREVLDHLRRRGAFCDLCTSAHIGDLQRVQELLDENPALANQPSEYVSYYPCSGTPLRNAAAAGHEEIVRLLLSRNADPNLPEEGIAPRGHALYSAATNGHWKIAKLLLEAGAHPNVEVESSADTLSRVIAKGDQKMLELLCSYGAARPVHLLAHSNDLMTAAAVFSADPQRANDPDALANAASGGHESFVRLMLRYYPDLPRRVTFPGWAVGAKNRELDELLFQHGLNPSAADWLGITPLHELARQGNIEKAAIFLDHGADLHARDEDICSTPLGWAAKFGRKEMAEFLLERGAMPNRTDDPPWATPLAWAQRRGHHEIADLLRRHGAV